MDTPSPAAHIPSSDPLDNEDMFISSLFHSGALDEYVPESPSALVRDKGSSGPDNVIPQEILEMRRWDRLSTSYEDEVYSLTRVEEKRRRIIDLLGGTKKVLIVGCGSATYLQEHIIEALPGAQVFATDSSQGMLDVAESHYLHPNLTYEKRDTCNLGFEDEFDAVVFTNSIVPETREQVVEMYASIYRALKDGGRLIGYNPSFDCVVQGVEYCPEARSRLDIERARFRDTVGMQCFHTRQLIFKELVSAGFRDIKTQKVGIDNDQEREQLARLYGEGADLFWEHFVEAKKPDQIPIDVTEIESGLAIESYTFEQVREDPEMVKVISNFYRYIFNNENGHYLVDPKSLEMTPPSNFFPQSENGSYIDLAELDSFKGFPVDPETKEKAIFWHDPLVTEKRFWEKLKKEGYLSVIKNSSGEIKALTFGYFASVGDVCSMEGWENPLHYASEELSVQGVDPERVVQGINDLISVDASFSTPPIDLDTEIFCYNCVAIDPKIQKSGSFSALIRSLFGSIPVNKKYMIALTEVQNDSKAFHISTRRGMVPAYGTLDCQNKEDEGTLLLVSEIDKWMV